MNSMKQKAASILLGLYMALFAAGSARAQQVTVKTVNSDSYIAIDNARIPSKARKTSAEVASTIDANTGVTVQHNDTEATNAKVSPYFIIAPTDTDINGVHSNNNNVDWNEAATSCRQYRGISGTDEKGSWRPPTQRELELIWVLTPKIKEVVTTHGIDFTFYDTYCTYWTSTTFSEDINKAWHVNMNDGNTNTSEKLKATSATTQIARYVRCIRDIK